MGDCFSGDAVFAELVQELAGENKIEELIDFRAEIAERRLLPRGAPEDCEDLNGGEQRAASVGELRRRRDIGFSGFGAKKRNDADGVTVCKPRKICMSTFGHFVVPKSN